MTGSGKDDSGDGERGGSCCVGVVRKSYIAIISLKFLAKPQYG